METENPYPVQRETVKNRKEGGEVILFFEVYMDKSFKERVKQIYFTTYIFLVPAVLVDFTFRYTYYQASIIEYVYVLLAVIIISNLAIIQMILTKRSFWNFIAMDVLIYALAVKIITIILKPQLFFSIIFAYKMVICVK